jgi:hypothetical protein
VPEQFTAGDASQARLLVVQRDSEKFQCVLLLNWMMFTKL